MFATFSRNTRRLVVALAVCVAASVVTGAAQASFVDRDSVSTLGSGSFEFRNGNVDWYWDATYIHAHLTGEIRLKNANGSCARMRMEYFDNSQSLDVKTGGPACATDGSTQTWTVDMDPDHDPRIDLVKVSLEKKTATADWSIVESAYFKPDLHVNDIRTVGDGVDFGDDTWGIGSPVGSGTLTWDRGDDMYLTPHLRGVLYINNSAGLCARMDLVYYDASGFTIDEKPGGRVCAPDNSLFAANIDLAPLTSDELQSVMVKMQTQASDGKWRDVTGFGSANMAYIEDF